MAYEIEPPMDLGLRILQRIRRQRRIRFASWLVGTLAAWSGAITTAAYALAQARESGAGEFIALLFSGNLVIYSAWRELLLAALESLPLLGLAALVAALALGLWVGTRTLRLINNPSYAH
jgi:hypothetical protein